MLAFDDAAEGTTFHVFEHDAKVLPGFERAQVLDDVAMVEVFEEFDFGGDSGQGVGADAVQAESFDSDRCTRAGVGGLEDLSIGAAPKFLSELVVVHVDGAWQLCTGGIGGGRCTCRHASCSGLLEPGAAIKCLSMCPRC